MNLANNPSIALFGCGTWGMNWVRVLSQMGCLAVVVDPNPQALARVKELYPSVRVAVSGAEALTDPAIQAVVIATPAPTHFETARLCLEAGKHVLVEKPMALKLADGHLLVETAHRLGKTLMVGHLFEHHPAVVKLVELIQAGALGRLQYVYSNQLNVGIVRDQENSMWSLAPHDIGLILRVVDQRPKEVWATGADYLSPGVQDFTLVHLNFESGIRAHIFVSWLHPFKERRLVVVGDQYMAVFDDGKPWSDKLTLYPHRVEQLDGHAPRIIKQDGRPVQVQEKEPLRAEADHFVECLRSSREPLTSGKSNLRVLEVLEAAQKSLGTSASNWSGSAIFDTV
jgi:UDP-2-acetamido-3-amino-2,3-dideoxy-glucuronate N-acetyltransferase